MRRSTTAALVILGTASFLSREVKGYRPFDETDADVVAHHGVELELGPVALQRSSEELVLVAPALIINYGIAPRLELVLEGKNERSLRSSTDQRWRPQDFAVSIKGLVRRGSLQGEGGLSIALEPSVLLPGRAQGGVGGQVGVILSVRGAPGALHLNVVPGVSRARAAAGSVGVIAEGPAAWRVRPVGEGMVYGEVGTGGLVAVLVGLIARVGQAWSVDAALRAQRAANETTFELRAGMTISFGS